MDQAAADPAVAVEEGVDRLELRVGDRGLGHGRQVVAVEERDEILDEAVDLGLGRRDVPGVNRAVEASADPVLLGAEFTWVCPGLACHERPVDRATSSIASGRSPSPRAIASSIATTLAATVRAIPFAARGSIRARARFRWLSS